MEETDVGVNLKYKKNAQPQVKQDKSIYVVHNNYLLMFVSILLKTTLSWTGGPAKECETHKK